jgi:phospholipid/cholesterol/gamma-HCH transport system substrate-binding protein
MITDRRTHFRYINEAVGAFVLVAVLVFVVAALQTGHLRNWFQPEVRLKVVMPPEGLFGLAKGAEVMILGTEAGVVERVVIETGQRIYAEASLKQNMMDFVRHDSKAIIRKQFGVAGASYLEIMRGEGAPLDWDYALIDAVAEEAPTQSIGEIIAEVRTKAIPIIDDAGKLLISLNAVADSIVEGQGALGRLLADDRLVRELETLLARVSTDVQRVAPILNSLETTAANVATLSSRIAEQSGDFPQMADDVRRVLTALEAVMADLSRTTPRLPVMVANVNAALTGVPLLMSQTQQVVFELEMLLQQLRSHWLFGGDASESPPEGRISSLEVKR